MLITVGHFGSLNPLGTYVGASQAGPFVSAVISLITILSGLYFLLQLAIAGLSMASSGGDEKDLAKSRRALGSALLGFIIVVVSYFAVGYIATRLGFPTIFNPSITGSSNMACVKASYTLPSSIPTFNYKYVILINSIEISSSSGVATPGKKITVSSSFNRSVYQPSDTLYVIIRNLDLGPTNEWYAIRSTVGAVPTGGCLTI